MPDESQGLQEKGKLGDDTSQVSLTSGVMADSSEGKSENGNILELDNLSEATHIINESTQSDDASILQSGLCESEVSIEVNVVKAARAAEPLTDDSLQKETGVTPKDADGDAQVNVSSDSLQTDNSTSQCDSDYNSMKSSPGYTCTSFSTELCGEMLSELDRSSFEKTNQVSSVNFSASYSKMSSKNNPHHDRGKDSNAVSKDGNSFAEGPSAADKPVHRTRDSIDVRWDTEEGEETQQSSQSRSTVKDGMCCCYQAVQRGFLQCVEETPAMLSGLVLSLAFCVTVIVLTATTGRVRHKQRKGHFIT